MTNTQSSSQIDTNNKKNSEPAQRKIAFIHAGRKCPKDSITAEKNARIVRYDFFDHHDDRDYDALHERVTEQAKAVNFYFETAERDEIIVHVDYKDFVVHEANFAPIMALLKSHTNAELKYVVWGSGYYCSKNRAVVYCW